MAVEKSSPCYICWFFTITLAVAAGPLLTDAIRAGIAYAHLDQVTHRFAENSNRVASSETKTTAPELAKAETLKKELPIVKLSPKEEMPENNMLIKVLPDKDTPKKDTPKEEIPGYQTTLQTCNFWKEEVTKDASSQNTAYMEAACNRLKSYQ